MLNLYLIFTASCAPLCKENKKCIPFPSMGCEASGDGNFCEPWSSVGTMSMTVMFISVDIRSWLMPMCLANWWTDVFYFICKMSTASTCQFCPADVRRWNICTALIPAVLQWDSYQTCVCSLSSFFCFDYYLHTGHMSVKRGGSNQFSNSSLRLFPW